MIPPNFSMIFFSYQGKIVEKAMDIQNMGFLEHLKNPPNQENNSKLIAIEDKSCWKSKLNQERAPRTQALNI